MTANDRAQQCESQILSPQPAESTHLMVGTFFILYPATDGCNPGHRARPLPVADKGSATVAQRSKFIGAPSRNEFWEPQEGLCRFKSCLTQPAESTHLMVGTLFFICLNQSGFEVGAVQSNSPADCCDRE